MESAFEAIEWVGDRLRLLDQRRLPADEVYLDFSAAPEVATAIRDMVVRGAPAIGITAAYAVVLSAQQHLCASGGGRAAVDRDIELLAAARPTAVNLVWALERMRTCLKVAGEDPRAALLETAQAIHRDDIEANRRMGDLGAGLINKGEGVLTYCNTGSLATGGYGTALGVVRSAATSGTLGALYACETRPWLQGARLTAWELVRDGLPVTLITDNAAAWLMQQQRVQWVITGADRVTANGDVINKIGTYSLALACRHHGVRMMVAAPLSTIDMALPGGEQVAIEQREPGEVLSLAGKPVAASGAEAWNPAFDVTPAALIDYLVTEAGVVAAPDLDKLRTLTESAGV